MALDIKYWKSRKKAGKAAWCVKFQTSQKFFQTKEEAQHFAKMKRYLEHNNKHGLKYYEEQGKSEGLMTDVNGFCELYYGFLQ